MLIGSVGGVAHDRDRAAHEVDRLGLRALVVEWRGRNAALAFARVGGIFADERGLVGAYEGEPIATWRSIRRS